MLAAAGSRASRARPAPTNIGRWPRRTAAFGYRQSPDKDDGPEVFVERAYAHFADAAAKWLLGTEPFVAKLNPAYAPYEDYDQLMRLEEWYGRD